MVGFVKLIYYTFVQYALEEEWPERKLLYEQLGIVPTISNWRHTEQAPCLAQANFPLFHGLCSLQFMVMNVTTYQTAFAFMQKIILGNRGVYF